MLIIIDNEHNLQDGSGLYFSAESIVRWSPEVKKLAEANALPCSTLLIAVGQVANGKRQTLTFILYSIY